jgi:hypothetical protein
MGERERRGGSEGGIGESERRGVNKEGREAGTIERQRAREGE